jgi:hypothetical protein
MRVQGTLTTWPTGRSCIAGPKASHILPFVSPSPHRSRHIPAQQASPLPLCGLPYVVYALVVKPCGTLMGKVR